MLRFSETPGSVSIRLFSYLMGTEVVSHGYNDKGRMVLHVPSSSAECNNEWNCTADTILHLTCTQVSEPNIK